MLDYFWDNREINFFLNLFIKKTPIEKTPIRNLASKTRKPNKIHDLMIAFFTIPSYIYCRKFREKLFFIHFGHGNI